MAETINTNHRSLAISISRNPYMCALIFFLIVFGSLGNLNAQMPSFTQLTESDGFVQRTAQCILQDSTGFLWFGTRDGLLRYDGYNTVEYRYDPTRMDSLGSNSVFFILEDHLKNIWIATEGGGLNKYVPEKNSFIRYQHDPKDPDSLSKNEIFALLEDRNGFLWIGTNSGGLNKFDPKSETFSHYYNDPGDPNTLSNDTIWHLYEDRSGVLWLSTYGGGLNKFDPATEIFTHYRHNPADPNSISNDIVGAVVEDSQGDLWVGGRDGLNRLDRKTGQFTRFMHDPTDPGSLTYTYVWDIILDSKDFLWLGFYGGGLNKFNTRTGKVVESYTNDSSDPNSIGSNLIWQIFEDEGGIIWLATEGGAVNKLSKQAEAFGRQINNPKKPHGLKANLISSISQGRNNILWLANTEGGFQKIDRSMGVTTLYRHEPGNANSLSHDNSQSIFEDRNGIVWIGSYGGGLNRFDPKTGVFVHFVHDPDDPTSISDNRVWSINEDQNDNLWIGSLSGLNRMGPERDKFDRIMHDPKDPHSISNNHIYTTYEDSRGNLWVGTSHGLNFKAKNNQQFEHYLHDPTNKNSIINNTVMALLEDSTGRLWIGTNGGISVYEPITGTFSSYTEKNGLISNSVRGILDDEDGNIWITTKKGLSKFNPITKHFYSYGKKDGLQGNEFYSGSICKTTNGELVIGGTNGINIFFPGTIKNNSHIPPVVLTQFSINNQPVAIGPSLSTTKDLTLSFKDKIFSFEFSALDYANPERNHYAYKLEGFDKDWIYVDSKIRMATYTNMRPGHYIFRVKGSNSDGLWNDEGLSIRITIIPLWWQTLWFKIFILILAGIGILGVHRLRIRGLRKNKYELEKLVTERTMELQMSENKLQIAKDELEQKVEERTADLKKANAEIKHEIIQNEQEEKRYKKTIESSIDGFWIIDTKGKFLEVNQAYCHMIGYSRDELSKMSIFDIEALMSPEEIQERIKKTVKNGSDRFESQQQHKNNKVVDVEISTTYTTDDNGLFFVFLRDITDRKITEKEKETLEKKLLQSQKMEAIGTLAGGIAHDFNNILFPIMGYTEMLIEDIPADSSIRDRLDKIYTGTLRARDLVRQILTFSIQGNNELELVMVEPIVKEALKLIRSTIPTTIEIKQDIQTECGVIKADPTQIHQVIMNLTTNAYHAMEKDGGELKVSLKEIELRECDAIIPDMKSGTYVCLLVSDTGIGMDNELINKIFDPFFTTKEKGKGTGMGLSVVHGIVAGMGGGIQAYSEPGKGTIFKVYFPVEKNSLEKQKCQTQEPIQGGTERILLVDDEESIITMEKQLLERLGYKVTSHTSSVGALETFRSNPNKFDLVITDMAMPKMPGDKLSTELGKIRSDIPILLCTGFSNIMSEEAAAILGINGFLMKPIMMKDFAQKIREVL